MLLSKSTLNTDEMNTFWQKFFKPASFFTLLVVAHSSFAADDLSGLNSPQDSKHLMNEFCSDCHNDESWSGGLSFDFLSPADDLAAGSNLEEYERILRKSRLREMPPIDEPQPSDVAMSSFTAWLESSLDEYAKENPNPGRATIRRLNRSEYTNAVQELLDLDVDFSDDLPTDDSGYGFDNIADVLTVSSTLMDRYLSVAGKLSRLAIGLAPEQVSMVSYTIPKDGSILNRGIPSYDERASDALPLDSRGGGVFNFYAPYDGSYEISGYLNANTNNEADRLKDDRVSFQVTLSAGAHAIGMAFRKQLALDETVQTLRNTTDLVVLPTEPPSELTLDFIVDGERVGETTVLSYHMRPRFSQANYLRDIMQIDVEGPFDVMGLGDTPSRNKIFSCRPSSLQSSENSCAREIIARLARQAYRRPVSEADIAPLMNVYASERKDSDFERGIAATVQALLVSPSFLFLHEQDPIDSAPGFVHPITDMEFASRLALFLWSSLPDEELISLAEKEELRKPEILQAQVKRMLADSRSEALTENFAGQWLYLRNLEYQRPDVFLFPEYGTRLQHAMRKETEMFFTSIVRENRSLIDFLDADYTYLNQQLAELYGIEGVKGSAFRKVMLDPADNRGGLIGQASILTVTSYGNHTSVVRRGKWILENILATPPPSPPPDIPALTTVQGGRQLNMREQMELHRVNPVCASCHIKMDAMGFALENFDAIGSFRTMDAGRPIDVSASMPDGTEFEGLSGLKSILLQSKDEFVMAFSEKMLTYALGRGLEAPDQPTVRSLARSVKEDDYRIQTLMLSIVKSEPFNLRRSPEI